MPPSRYGIIGTNGTKRERRDRREHEKKSDKREKNAKGKSKGKSKVKSNAPCWVKDLCGLGVLLLACEFSMVLYEILFEWLGGIVSVGGS